ncbi:MAG: fibronectin type III domain-containing protein [Gammaproteobacteria bacterium]
MNIIANTITNIAANIMRIFAVCCGVNMRPLHPNSTEQRAAHGGAGIRACGALVLAAVLLGGAGQAWAQQTAQLSSLVITDPHGNVVTPTSSSFGRDALPPQPGQGDVVATVTFPYVFLTATLASTLATLRLGFRPMGGTAFVLATSGVAVRVDLSIGENDPTFSVSHQPATADFANYTVQITRTDGGIPADPVLAAPTAGPGALALAWTAPTDTGGADITGYKVRWATTAAADTFLNPGGATGADVPGGASAATHTIFGLTQRAHEVQVAAVNTHGLGGWSAAQSGTPTDDPQSVICLANPAITAYAACLAAAYAGHSIAENASGAQSIFITAFTRTATPAGTPLTFTLTATDDAANAIVANTDTMGALPAFAGATLTLPGGATSVTSSAFSLTTDSGGDGGRINLGFALSGGGADFQNLADAHKVGSFLQILNAEVLITAADTGGACPAAHGAAVSMRALAEGGDAAPLCVSLLSQPPGDVAVTCAAADSALVATTPASLNFTSANWQTAQKISMSAPNNNVAASGASDTLTCAASAAAGTSYDGASGEVMLTVTDDDVLSGSGVLTGGVIREGGGAQMVDVVATLGGTIVAAADCTVNMSIRNAEISGTAGDALAASPGDYSGALSVSDIIIAAGQASGRSTVTITPVVDLDSDIESIPLSASGSCGGVTVNFGAAEILIDDFNFGMLDGVAGAAAADGILAARYLAGVRGAALAAGLGLADEADVAAAAAAALAGSLPRLDVDGDGRTTMADGIMIARFFLGVTSGAGLYEGQADATNGPGVGDTIMNNLSR